MFSPISRLQNASLFLHVETCHFHWSSIVLRVNYHREHHYENKRILSTSVVGIRCMQFHIWC